MLFMNEFEIGEALDRYGSHPVLGKAARFLARYREQVNQHSDGWPYWSAPVRAAAKLMTLLQDANKAGYQPYASDYTEPSEADLRAALRPIRAFYTRRGYAAGMVFPELDAK